MSYQRVIPRDLFNEGNLLKCLGNLYIQLQKIGLEDHLIFQDSESGGLDHFDISQEQLDGSTHCNNVFLVTSNGQKIELTRPLNSRQAYPLEFIFNDNEYYLFNSQGDLMPDMDSILKNN